MPTTSSDLIQAALNLPEGLAEFLEKPIPEIGSVVWPTTVDDAQIAMGQLSANINTILEAFVGLKPIQLQLRISQYHPSIIGMLCGELEFMSDASGGMTVIAPKDGGCYPGWFDGWLVRVSGEFASVSVVCGDDSFDLKRNDTDWSLNWPIAIGEWTATITGTKEDGSTVEETISFAVVSWDSYPAEGSEYAASELDHISVDTSADGGEIESVAVQWFETTIDLSAETLDIWTVEGLSTDTILEGTHNMVIAVTYATGAIVQSVVEFVVSGEVG